MQRPKKENSGRPVESKSFSGSLGKPKRKEINLSELKKALEDSLEHKEKPIENNLEHSLVPQEKKPEVPNPVSDSTQDKGIIQPGQKIKF